MIRFDSRVVIVTGAGKGLGRAYALAFAARGARVVVNNRLSGDLTVDSAQDVVDEIQRSGGTALVEHADVSTTAGVDDLVRNALAAYGRIDAVVHNAGSIESVGVAELTDEIFARVFDVNAFSALRLTRAVLPVLRQHGYGKLVFTTSTAGLYGNAGLAAYGMAKAALIALARAVAAEEAGHGILANVVCPTAITRMTEAFVADEKLRRALEPDCVVPAVLWLASDACTCAGRVIVAGGGNFGSAHVLQSDGVWLDGAERTPEGIGAAADRILAAEKLRSHADAGAHFASLLTAVRSREGQSG